MQFSHSTHNLIIIIIITTEKSWNNIERFGHFNRWPSRGKLSINNYKLLLDCEFTTLRFMEGIDGLPHKQYM